MCRSRVSSRIQSTHALRACKSKSPTCRRRFETRSSTRISQKHYTSLPWQDVWQANFKQAAANWRVKRKPLVELLWSRKGSLQAACTRCPASLRRLPLHPPAAAAVEEAAPWLHPLGFMRSVCMCVCVCVCVCACGGGGTFIVRSGIRWGSPSASLELLSMRPISSVSATPRMSSAGCRVCICTASVVSRRFELS